MKKTLNVLTMLCMLTALAACATVMPPKLTVEVTEAAVAEAVEENEQGEHTEQSELSQAELKEYLRATYPKMNIDGSTSLIPLHQSLSELFGTGEEEILHTKTVEAFDKFISGDVDILLSVDYSGELIEKAKAAGIALQKKEITREAFIFLINRQNPVKNLSTEQIKGIYSGKITNWSEVGGEDAPIRAYQRNPDSGSQMRMLKFMGDTPLVHEDVIYVSAMGAIFEYMERYDEGAYSIAYNIYTFTGSEYGGDDVQMLSVDGVAPDDKTIFDESYPVGMKNYIFYDGNSAQDSEFAENLRLYLLSEEGQKLIADAGYVNLNTELPVSDDIVKPYDIDSDDTEFSFYDEEKSEFYAADENGGLLTFNSYEDYVLRGTVYINNEKARAFVNRVFNSEITAGGIAMDTLFLYEGIIYLSAWMDGSHDGEDFFNYLYDGKYYSDFEYHVDEDKFVLRASSKDNYDLYLQDGYLNGFEEYLESYEPDAVIEIGAEDLKDISVRSEDFVDPFREKIELRYIKPF